MDKYYFTSGDMRMITGNLYNEMVARNITTSMRAWSEVWAGRSHNFATTHWGKPIPAETAIHIRKKLISEGYHDLAAMLLIALLDDDRFDQHDFGSV